LVGRGGRKIGKKRKNKRERRIKRKEGINTRLDAFPRKHDFMLLT